MGLQAELSLEHGLVDPDTGSPPQVEPYEGATEDFLATPGVAGTSVEAALHSAMTLATRETVEGRRWWDALRRFFTPQVHTVVATSDHVMDLEGYWMTLPDVAGTSARLTVTSTASTGKSASFVIAGIGGGPEFTITLKEGLSHETAVTERVTLSTTATFQKVEVRRQNELIGTYPRLVNIDRNNLGWRFEPDIPPASSRLGEPRFTRHFDKSATEGPTTVTLEISRGETWEASAGLGLANLGGIAAKLSARVSYESDVQVEYTLPGRRRYLATRFSDFPAYLWSVE
jgi:hypothetical protein